MALAETVGSHIEEAREEIAKDILDRISALRNSGREFEVELDQYLGHQPKDRRTVSHFWEGFPAYDKPTWNRYVVSADKTNKMLVQANSYTDPRVVPNSMVEIDFAEIPLQQFSFEDLTATAIKLDSLQDTSH